MDSPFPVDPVSTIPAPYGGACQNCSHAKCKCMRRAGGGGCERCYRLNKECQQPMAVRKRIVKRTCKSRTAQIEKKLDGLISMLNHSPEKSTVPVPPSLGPGIDSNTHPCIPSLVATNTASSSSSPKLVTPCGVASAPSSINYGAPDVTEGEAEECLKRFQTYNLRYFPFYNIPPATTPQKFRQERPFFWRCITAVSCRSAAKRAALTEDVRRLVAQSMVMEHERNIDMLLGLLVIMGWPSYQIANKPFLNLYVHLALAIVRDLGLNKPVQTEPPRIIQSLRTTPGAKWTSTARSIEERRAVLGCFLISSTISSYLQRAAALSWTSHLDECMRVLAAKESCPGDQVLIQLVRSQLIVERLSQIPQAQVDYGGHDGSSMMLLPFYLKELESRLEENKSQIPSRIKQNEVVLLHHYSTESFVHELALLFKAPILPDNPKDFNRLHSLCACLQSVKAWFDLLFSIHLESWIAFPFTVFSHMSRLLMILFQLSTLDDPGWDKGLVRNSIDLLQVLNFVIERMREASLRTNQTSHHPEDDIFTRGARMLQYMKQSWEGDLLATAPALSGKLEKPANTASEHIQMAPYFPMDLFDEALIADLWSDLQTAV